MAKKLKYIMEYDMYDDMEAAEWFVTKLRDSKPMPKIYMLLYVICSGKRLKLFLS